MKATARIGGVDAQTTPPGVRLRGGMRSRLAIVGVVLAAWLAAVPAARADSGPNLSATPATVRLGHAQTIRGSEWPAIEFCRRTVRLAVLRPHRSAVVGFARVRDNGTWSFSW